MTARITKGWSGGKRGGIVAAIAGVHLVVLMAIVTQSVRATAPETPAMALLAFREPAPEPASAVLHVEIPPPALLEIVSSAPEPFVDVSETVATPTVAPITAAAISGDCIPADALQSALSAAPEVRLALARVPVGDRSVADAVVIWNVDWSALASAKDAPLSSVREVVTRTLQSLPPACVSETVTGPRLLLIALPRGMMVLAFGSGVWRWQDVAEKA